MTSRDPNVILVANPGADLYGSDRMVVENVKALVADGLRVIVTVPETGPLVPLLQDAGAEVEICPTPIIRKSYMSPKGVVALARQAFAALGPSWRLLKASRAATLLVNTITPPLWFPLGKLAGMRTVCHVHEAEGTASKLVKRALFLPLVFCDRAIINSEFSLGVLREGAPQLAPRTRVVYNTVAGPDTVTPPRARLDGPVRLLFIGRLSNRKGPHVAVDAVRVLRDRGTDARLSLLGAVFPGNEAYERDLHAQVAQDGLQDRVTFLGFRPSIWPDVAANDIVVIPSTVDEPFGNTAVEASLGARPLVVSAIAGLKEASGFATSAIGVPASDPDAIADAVQRIIERWEIFAAAALYDSTAVAKRLSFERYAAGIVAAVFPEAD